MGCGRNKTEQRLSGCGGWGLGSLGFRVQGCNGFRGLVFRDLGVEESLGFRDVAFRDVGVRVKGFRGFGSRKAASKPFD